MFCGETEISDLIYPVTAWLKYLRGRVHSLLDPTLDHTRLGIMFRGFSPS